MPHLKQYIDTYFNNENVIVLGDFNDDIVESNQNNVQINGATADPWLKTIRPPNIISIIRIGNNQNFFLTFKNFQNSIIKDIIY